MYMADGKLDNVFLAAPLVMVRSFSCMPPQCFFPFSHNKKFNLI